MIERPIAQRDREIAQNLAMVNYGLLFASIFFAGLPAIVAAVIAYSQRDEAPPSLRSHMNFQIRIFWVGFALSLAASVCALAAAITAIRDLFEISSRSRVESFFSAHSVTVDMSRVSIDGAVIGLVVGFALFSLLTAVWLVAAPAFGFIRLASQRAIGHSAAP